MNLCLQLGCISRLHHLLYTCYKNNSQGDKPALQAIAATLRATLYARLYACLPSLEADLFLPYRTRGKYINADLFLPYRTGEKYINVAPCCERCCAPVGVPGWPLSFFSPFVLAREARPQAAGPAERRVPFQGALERVPPVVCSRRQYKRRKK
jgi:hypothetical protein